MSDAAATAALADRARTLAPVVWLVGKVQSGKTSIIRTLTGATDAEIGAGFRACTRSARIFDFPHEVPIIRFLDTRGLGEAAYDPADDIAFCEDRAHLILAVAKALDAEQGAVVKAVRAARERHPDWPLVVAQTSLHEGYPHGQGHVLPYPFAGGDAGSAVPDRPASRPSTSPSGATASTLPTTGARRWSLRWSPLRRPRSGSPSENCRGPRARPMRAPSTRTFWGLPWPRAPATPSPWPV
jgi:hypothetical protein